MSTVDRRVEWASAGEAVWAIIGAARPADGGVVPVVHRFGPYRFHLWSNESRLTGEPPHIHVRSAEGEAIFWLVPVSLRQSWGYTDREVARIRRIVVAHRDELLRNWHDDFGD